VDAVLDGDGDPGLCEADSEHGCLLFERDGHLLFGVVPDHDLVVCISIQALELVVLAILLFAAI
jgi:hypothetical protein